MRILTGFKAAFAALTLSGCVVYQPTDNLAGDYLGARFAERQNSVAEAAASFAEAHAQAPGNGDLLKAAFFYNVAAGDIDAAVAYAREMSESPTDADDGFARMALAAYDLKAGRLTEARAWLDGEFDKQFLNTIAFVTDVWIEAGLSGPVAAIVMLEKPPADAFAGFNLLHKAILSDMAGDHENARTAYQASVFGLGGPAARSGFGAYLERTGEEAAAREYYSLLASDPGPMRRAGRQGLARLDAGAPSQAYAYLTPAQGAANITFSFAAAIIEQAADQRARAEEAGFNVGDPQYNYPLALAQLALYLDPDFDEARRLVGTVLNIYGEYDAAAAVLAKIPPASPYFEQARIEMAGALALQDREHEAIAALREASRLDPEGVEVKWTLANHLAVAGDHEGAVRVLSEIIAALPEGGAGDASRFYISRGAALIELGRWEEAESDLEKAVEIDPDDATALNYLGYSWAERGVNLDEAFKLIEKALELEPQSGAITDSLGWAHYQLGHYEEAVGHLERAASLEPADPTVTDHLGDVYWRLGRKIEARYEWRRSLDLDPSDAQAAAIREKLERGLDAPARD